MTKAEASQIIKAVCKHAIEDNFLPAWDIVDACAVVLFGPDEEENG